MIPYKVKFVTEGAKPQQFHFETNEKPVKGEVYTIQEPEGKAWEARITDVQN